MLVEAAKHNSTEGNYDFACLRRFRRWILAPLPSHNWTVALRQITSDESDDEHYWGTDNDWEELDADAPTREEFEGVIAFLRSTGRAST